MTVPSKTVLLQMRFVRAGAPFCSIGAKTTIDAKNFDFTDKGGSFYGVSNTETPPIYTYAASPVRQGDPFRIDAGRQIRFGGSRQGEPIFSQLPNPAYTPYTANPVRQGAPFKWNTAKSSINASYGFYNQGQPFYVYYDGAAPVLFNATRFFSVF